MRFNDFVDEGPRRSGRTTRIVDECIQELFTTGYTRARDHYPSDNMRKLVFNKLMRRLHNEHLGLKVKTNHEEFTIELNAI